MCSHLEGGRDVLEGGEPGEIAKHSEAAEHLSERFPEAGAAGKFHLDDDHGGAVADNLTGEEGEDEEGEDGEDLHSGANSPHSLHIHLLLDHQVAKAANAKPKDELGDVVGNGDDEGGFLQAVAVDLLQVLLHQQDHHHRPPHLGGLCERESIPSLTNLCCGLESGQPKHASAKNVLPGRPHWLLRLRLLELHLRLVLLEARSQRGGGGGGIIGGGGGLVLPVVAFRQQLLLFWRDPGILQRIVRHEDVVEDRHEDAEGSGEVEEELPADVVNDGAREAEEHPARLNAKEDADTHPRQRESWC